MKNKISLSDDFIKTLIDHTEIDIGEYIVPSAYITYMKVSDYLILTTLGHWEANEIIKITVDNKRFKCSEGRRSPTWDNERLDNLEVNAIPALWINSEGQIVMHDGRHRTAIAAHSKISRVPVVIHCVDSDMNPSKAFVLDKIKDQYHKGERKTLDSKQIYPIILFRGEDIKDAIRMVHGSSSHAQHKDKNLDREFTV